MVDTGRFKQPLAQPGQVALMEIVTVNELGAFAAWAQPKDLFIPFAEQHHTLRKGQKALVRVYLDNQNRFAGSTRIDHWIEDDASGLSVGEQVSLVIADTTDLGIKAIINHHCWGLLYSNELFQTLHTGQVIDGYIKQIRSDNKIDLSLEKPGFSKDRIDNLGQLILNQLNDNGGQLALTDKSPPQEIYAAFGVSKNAFKKAIGSLYKQRLIRLESACISLIEGE